MSWNFEKNSQDERLLLIHATILRSLSRRRPIAMPDIEETPVVTLGEGKRGCIDSTSSAETSSHENFCGCMPCEGTVYSDMQSSKSAAMLPLLPQSERDTPESPQRNIDFLSSRQRLPEEARQGRNSLHSSKRMRLLIFIKIVLKCLDYSDPILHLKAKKIVTDCTRRNREGVPGYNPLEDAITRQLRIAVGEVHWERAKRLMEYYMKKRAMNDLQTDKLYSL